MRSPYMAYEAVTDDQYAPTATNAAISVGLMIAASVIFLTLLKRSGFRAMVAVGR